MKTNLENRAEAYVREHRLLSRDDRVCAGFSGGADSLCLLLLLAALREKLGFRLSAAHVNHHIRGEAGDEDEAFVRRTCSSLAIPLRVFHCRAEEASRILQCPVEEAGRLLRLEAWRRCTEEAGVNLIALAHHADDQAETVLFRAARGTSLAGLAGIRPRQRIVMPEGRLAAQLRGLLTEEPVDAGDNSRESAENSSRGSAGNSSRDGAAEEKRADGAPIVLTLIRPLLFAARGEIEDWLRQREYCWRTDQTNLEDICARNVIRHQVIPALIRDVNAGTVRHLGDLAGDAAEADRFLREEADRRAQAYVYRKADGGQTAIYVRSALLDEAPLLQRYILMTALRETAGPAAAGSPDLPFAGLEREAGMPDARSPQQPYPLWEDGMRDLGREQIRQLQQLLALPAGKKTDLPNGLTAIKEYGEICLIKNAVTRLPAVREEEVKPDTADCPAPVLLLSDEAGSSGAAEARLGEWTFRCRLIPAEKCPFPPPQKQCTKWLDYDKIGKCITVRTRRDGDWIALREDGGRKKLKDYLIDRKVPRAQRDGIPLLTSGSEVFWIVGHRISERAKVRPCTETVLEITAEHILRQENTDE